MDFDTAGFVTEGTSVGFDIEGTSVGSVTDGTSVGSDTGASEYSISSEVDDTAIRMEKLQVTLTAEAKKAHIQCPVAQLLAGIEKTMGDIFVSSIQEGK